jgi:hypothetical protein
MVRHIHTLVLGFVGEHRALDGVADGANRRNIRPDRNSANIQGFASYQRE